MNLAAYGFLDYSPKKSVTKSTYKERGARAKAIESAIGFDWVASSEIARLTDISKSYVDTHLRRVRGKMGYEMEYGANGGCKTALYYRLPT